MRLMRLPWILAFCFLAGVAAFHSCYQLIQVSGNSMFPTLKNGELILLSKRCYRSSEPSRGDIVVARVGPELIIKRVIGLPGETVEVRNGVVYINERPTTVGFDASRGTDLMSLGKGRLSEDRYALLGDNRTMGGQTGHAVVSKAQILGRILSFSI